MTLPPFPAPANLLLSPPFFNGSSKNIEQCPTDPGAYLVWVWLDTPLKIERPRPAQLASGFYCYAGSARGPGGLKARLLRHLRPDKKVRWHIDQLTTKANHSAAWAWPDGEECQLIQTLIHQQGFSIPQPGFGSSDCRCCPAHLLAWHPHSALPKS